jgi:hypothetical protein
MKQTLPEEMVKNEEKSWWSYLVIQMVKNEEKSWWFYLVILVSVVLAAVAVAVQFKKQLFGDFFL